MNSWVLSSEFCIGSFQALLRFFRGIRASSLETCKFYLFLTGGETLLRSEIFCFFSLLLDLIPTIDNLEEDTRNNVQKHIIMAGDKESLRVTILIEVRPLGFGHIVWRICFRRTDAFNTLPYTSKHAHEWERTNGTSTSHEHNRHQC